MELGDWRRVIGDMPPDTLVVFYHHGDVPLQPGEYCDGHSVAPSAVWEDGRWRPCVLVELGEAF